MKRNISESLRSDIKSSVGLLSQQRALDFFAANSGGQQAFFRCQKPQMILSGGNDSGKTVCDVVQGAYHTLPEKDIHGKFTGYTIHPFKRIRIRPTGILGWFSNYSESVQIDNFRPIYEKYMSPYEIHKRVIGGARKWAEFEANGRIDFKCISQGFQVYRGKKIDWIGCDEPHPMAIYNECLARISKSPSSTMWTTMTPVVDGTQTAATVQDVLWMKRHIIDPYLRDPDSFPLLEVLFVSTEENAAYIDLERTKQLFRSMSPEEQSIRLHGLFLSYVGNCFFNKPDLELLERHISDYNPEPEYVSLEYDEKAKDEFKVVPNVLPIDYFPDYPEEGYVIRVWEHPVQRKGMVRPEYFISADVAEGKKGGDYTNAYVFKGNGQIAASLHGRITEIQLARELYLLGMYYCDRQFKPARLAIEVNNFGKITQAFLISGNPEARIPKYGKDRLYHRPDPKALESGKKVSSGSPGWLTTGRTRQFVLTNARMAMHQAVAAMQKGLPSPIPDIYCVEEGMTFILGKDGKYKAQEGYYDDRIMSLGIGRCLLEHYGHKLYTVEPQTYGPTDDDNYYRDPETGVYYLNTQGLINRKKRKASLAGGKF